ncbi:MAG: hypothetical protein ACJAYR_002561 [Sneathiella sp.]|jgi:hypothetical protein
MVFNMLLTSSSSQISEIVSQGYNYWMSCKGDREMPRWSDIDPAKFKPLLPSAIVTHVLRDPLDFVEMITGENILERSNSNSMRRNWRNFPGREPGSKIWEAFENIVITKTSNFSEIPYVGPHKEFLKVHTVSCPISNDGETVNKILSFVDYVSQTDEDIEEDVASNSTNSLNYRPGL